MSSKQVPSNVFERLLLTSRRPPRNQQSNNQVHLSGYIYQSQKKASSCRDMYSYSRKPVAESALQPDQCSDCPASFVFPSYTGKKITEYKGRSRKELCDRPLPNYDVMPTKEKMESFKVMQKNINVQRMKMARKTQKEGKLFVLDTFMPDNLPV